MIFPTSTMRIRRKPPIWVIAFLKRAGKRARRKKTGKRVRRKTKLRTNAGTTAEGVQDEVEEPGAGACGWVSSLSKLELG